MLLLALAMDRYYWSNRFENRCDNWKGLYTPFKPNFESFKRLYTKDMMYPIHLGKGLFEEKDGIFHLLSFSQSLQLHKKYLSFYILT